MTTDQLYSEIRRKGSMLCVGLDTEYTRIPECIKAGRSVPAAVLEFNRRIIDATAPHCVAYKPNLAFYEYLGVEGMDVLDKTVDHIRTNHPEQFIIADAKRGDIGNTARMYAKSLFETFDFDAVTLSPYMGSETVTPFLDYPGRFSIVVALSSNPSSADFQTSEKEGKPLYRVVMEKMMELSTPENMMFVIGATKADKFKVIRSFCPDYFFLVPGVGAQGGSAEEVIAGGANSKGGLLINSSRGIIYASSGEDFEEAAANAARSTAVYQ